MTDLISREAALTAVTDIAVKWGVTGEPAILLATKNAIRALPVAQVICTWPSCSHAAKGQCQPLSPSPVDASQTPDPVLTDPRVKALVEAAKERLHFFDDTTGKHCPCGACEPLLAALRAIGGEV